MKFLCGAKYANAGSYRCPIEDIGASLPANGGSERRLGAMMVADDWHRTVVDT